MNIITELQGEMNRVRKVLKIYEDTCPEVGHVAILMMKETIKNGETAIANGDVVDMATVISDLKGFNV